MGDLTRRHAMLAGSAAMLLGNAGNARSKRRPNILFILADDLGYADLSCYGRDDYTTPHIDSLATDGVKLSQAYSNSSVCSPTRMALMTGRYQYRYPGGLDEPLGTDENLGLPPSEATLASLLRGAGYRTTLIGKWHLGLLPKFGPLKSGYDRFFGIYQGGADYFTHGMTIRGKYTHDLWEDETEIHHQGYLTDLITDRAVAEIGRLSKAGNPFLMSLHYTAPHWPWEGPLDEAVAKSIRDSFHYDGGSAATYRAMMQSLDQGVGRVLQALSSAGVAKDTIVIFTSDNGGERFSKNWPFSGMKGDLLEGGIRVPALVRWPRTLKRGGIVDQPVMTMDWLPTLLAAAGAEAPASVAFDGMNMLPAIKGNQTAAPRSLFWRHKAGGQSAARNGNLKYLAMDGKEYLFDLLADPLERANLKMAREAEFKALKTEFEQWNSQMLPYGDTNFSYDLRDKGALAGR